MTPVKWLPARVLTSPCITSTPGGKIGIVIASCQVVNGAREEYLGHGY